LYNGEKDWLILRNQWSEDSTTFMFAKDAMQLLSHNQASHRNAGNAAD
jgi:hypothetical protein